MKKAKLAAGILTSLMCVGALAACNEVKYSSDGYILTYKASDGSEKHYTADDLFRSYYSDADKTQTMFDSIYKLIVKSEFATPAKAADYKSIKELAARDVDGDKQTAKKNADTNGTSYDTEFDSILSGKGCKDEAELLQHYIYERELKQFEDDFYDNNMNVLRGDNAKEDGKLNDTTDYSGYLKSMVPYHVSHILVKLDDESQSKYWNGTIGEQDCYDLYDVVSALAKDEKSFGSIAKTYSEDEGSAAQYGDLGIMDKSTGYVDEFKLGVYAYENMFGSYKTDVNASKVGMTPSMITEYGKYASYDYGTPGTMQTIPYSIFSTYFNKDSEDCVAKITKGYKDTSVHDDDSLYYPRNVYYNEYINRHAYSLIEDDTSSGLPGFQEIFGDGHKYLCAKHVYTNPVSEPGELDKIYTYSPILVVRAGTSDYQGVHFITVNRNPFEVTDKNDCSIKDYYTTLFPGQSNYPQRTVDSGAKKIDQQTYVNFNNLDVTSAKDRADKLKSSIKSFDSNLSKKIYQVYKDRITFTESNKAIGDSIDKWIKVSIEKTAYDNNESFEKTFNKYIDNLHQQQNEREKRLASVCAIGYKLFNDDTYGTKTITAMKADGTYGTKVTKAMTALKARYATPADCGYTYADWDAFEGAETVNSLFSKVGGLCNDGKTHN